MMADKVVKNVATGETFIATEWNNYELFKVRLDIWRLDHTQYCPLPADHRVFYRPQDYGCVFIEFRPYKLEPEVV